MQVSCPWAVDPFVCGSGWSFQLFYSEALSEKQRDLLKPIQAFPLLLPCENRVDYSDSLGTCIGDGLLRRYDITQLISGVFPPPFYPVSTNSKADIDFIFLSLIVID